MIVLAIDLGKSGCRVLRVAEARRWHGESSGALGMSHPDGPASALDAIEHALEAGNVPDHGVDVVCLGAAGVASAPQSAARIATMLADRFTASALVTSDAVTSHAGALGGGPGVVLAAGTGAVAITFDDEDALVQVDGWGQMLGDEGSGWWIGREGLMAACRDLDGRGPRTRLRAEAERTFADLRELPRRLGDATAAIPVLASFAPVVLAGAERGDEVAEDILQRAIEALAATVAAAARRAPSAPVIRCCLIGGLAAWPVRFHAALRERAERQVPFGLHWREPAGTSLDGAAMIAMDPGLVHRNSCVSAGVG